MELFIIVSLKCVWEKWWVSGDRGKRKQMKDVGEISRWRKRLVVEGVK